MSSANLAGYKSPAKDYFDIFPIHRSNSLTKEKNVLENPSGINSRN